MAELALHLQGLDALLKKLTSLEQLRHTRAGIEAAAVHVKGKLAQYPPVNRFTRQQVYGQTFESDKQRRAFFALLRKGKIEVPYRRGESPGSQTFGRRWTIQMQNAGLTAVIGNNARYGPLLMDADSQTRYAAKVGWKTAQSVLEAESPDVNRFIQTYLDLDLAE